MSEVTDYWKPELEKADARNRELGLRLGKMEEALRVARSMIILDEMSPAVHAFEVEKRNEARRKVAEIIDSALTA